MAAHGMIKERVLAVYCAAARGSTILGFAAPPRASTIAPAAASSISVFELLSTLPTERCDRSMKE